MHIDITGWNPTSPAGAHYRVARRTWGEIHSLITDLCADLLDIDLLLKMQAQDGAGPKDEATCLEMAERFKKWRQQRTTESRIESKALQRWGGRFETFDHRIALPRQPIQLDDQQLTEWIDFLRHCRGFEVW